MSDLVVLENVKLEAKIRLFSVSLARRSLMLLTVLRSPSVIAIVGFAPITSLMKPFVPASMASKRGFPVPGIKYEASALYASASTLSVLYDDSYTLK